MVRVQPRQQFDTLCVCSEHLSPQSTLQPQRKWAHAFIDGSRHGRTIFNLQRVMPRLAAPHRTLIQHGTPQALQSRRLHWTRLVHQDGKAAFRRRDVPRWSAFLQPHEEVCQRLSLTFLQMRTITRMKKLSWTACAAACRPF